MKYLSERNLLQAIAVEDLRGLTAMQAACWVGRLAKQGWVEQGNILLQLRLLLGEEPAQRIIAFADKDAWVKEHEHQ